MSAPAKFAGADIATADRLPLEELARQANESARKAEGTLLYHAACAGVWLLAAKAKVKHGEWLKWLEANFDRSHVVASRYMGIAEQCKRDPQIADQLGAKSVRGLLAAIGKPQDGHGENQKPHKGKAPNFNRGTNLPAEPPVVEAEFVVHEPEVTPGARIKIESLDDSPTEKVAAQTSPEGMTATLLAGVAAASTRKAPAPPPRAVVKSIAADCTALAGEWLALRDKVTALELPSIPDAHGMRAKLLAAIRTEAQRCAPILAKALTELAETDEGAVKEFNSRPMGVAS